MNMVLDQITLRCIEPKDAERLYHYRNDWQVTRLLGGFSTGYSVKDIHDWMEFHRARTDEIIWTIADKEGDVCLGHVGLYKIDHRIRNAEFAILIGDESWQGRGIGQQISHQVIEFGFQQLNLHRIQLSVLATNSRAIHLYEKLGFKQEGVLRDGEFRDGGYIDVLIMALLESEA